MNEQSDDPRVLVVDDEAEVADVYALRLREVFDVETAYGGQEALDTVDESFDVVLLDRRMPSVSGDEVLERIRERGLDCRVIMITAVDPDFDIVDMSFDDYLCKPVRKADLVGAIEQQLTASRYDERLTEYIEVSSKVALLEAQKSERELEDSEEFDRVQARATELRDRMDDALGEFDDFESAFREIGRQPE